MSKAIIISIRPEWVVKILNGEKTLEIRKTCPGIFKHLKSYEGCSITVYIYCTKNGPYLHPVTDPFTKKRTWVLDSSKWYMSWNGKIVAKFVLNKIEDIYLIEDPDFPPYDICDDYVHRTLTLNNSQLIRQSQLDDQDLFDYLEEDEKVGYAWHINDLTVLDKPKELNEFYNQFKCKPCRGDGYRKPQVSYNPDLKCLQSVTNSGYEYVYPIERAPQDWCYCEVV